MLEPYAIVTARNVVASMWQEKDRHRRNQHRVVDLRPPGTAGRGPAGRARSRRRAPRRSTGSGAASAKTLLAHEVAGQDTRSLAAELGSTAGAVAAQLNRTRARLRVEYLLALEQAEPPTDRCRPVLLALSSGDRRRQREVDAARHLLECELCARLSQPLMERGQQRDDEVRIPIHVDADIVAARQTARELATRAGFSGTDLTLIATAVSEIARNIVRFAEPGRGRRRARRPAAHAAPGRGPGHRPGHPRRRAGAGRRLQHLPRARAGPARRPPTDGRVRVVSEVGRGTTVTMTKWRQEG